MNISIHKTGLTKNGKKWVCAKCSWTDKNGITSNEYFFVKPWHHESFEESLKNDDEIKEQIKAIYGTQTQQ